MGNLGVAELLFIAILALLIFGPKRLPEMARMIGKAVREFKRATQELSDEIKMGLDSPPPTAEKPEESSPPKPGPRV